MNARRRAQRCRGQCGQALVETALVTLIIITLFVGVYAVATFANDQNTATTAVRAGGRFGAQLGNGRWQSGTPNSPLPVDKQIVAEVCDVAKTMPNLVRIDDITIYQPAGNSDGSLAGTDLANVYTVDSGCHVATSTFLNYSGSTCVNFNDLGYTLDCRNQNHPNEARLGVRLRYDYLSPTPIIQVLATGSVYTVVTVAPIFT